MLKNVIVGYVYIKYDMFLHVSVVIYFENSPVHI